MSAAIPPDLPREIVTVLRPHTRARMPRQASQARRGTILRTHARARALARTRDLPRRSVPDREPTPKEARTLAESRRQPSPIILDARARARRARSATGMSAPSRWGAFRRPQRVASPLDGGHCRNSARRRGAQAWTGRQRRDAAPLPGRWP